MSSPAGILAGYCVLILLASLAGGWIPQVVRLTHRRMELALSFVSGVMLGIALLHLLPHAILERAAAMPDLLHDAAHAGDDGHGHGHGPGGHVWHDLLDPVLLWVLAGFTFMFLIERFFCFHHHDPPHDDPGAEGGAEPAGDHAHHHHALTWTGATVGLTLHTLIAGVALAAAAQSGTDRGDAALPAGFGTFLVIFLHKPFDSLTIGTLMAAARRSAISRHVVNGLFSLVIPLGVVLFYVGFSHDGVGAGVLSGALAFSAGAFLCIALSDVLPELQFHQHDRLKLSAALILGLVMAWAVRLLEAHG